MASIKKIVVATLFSAMLMTAFSMPAAAAPFDDANAVYAKTLAFGQTLVTGTGAPKNAAELAKSLYGSLSGSGISHEGLARVVAQTMYELGADFDLGFAITPRDAITETLRVLDGDLADLKGGVSLPIFTGTKDRFTYGKDGIDGVRTVKFTIADIGTGDIVIVAVEEPVSAG
jgi:hypothetical protein